MTSASRFSMLVMELNRNPLVVRNAREWAKFVMIQDPTTSDTLMTQTHLNILCMLGFVKRHTTFHGKSERYTYSRCKNRIALAGD